MKGPSTCTLGMAAATDGWDRRARSTISSELRIAASSAVITVGTQVVTPEAASAVVIAMTPSTLASAPFTSLPA